ncbi:MAG TPA: HAD family phosphatase [Gemmatimonadaceae bacterium]|jgi:beta-phosphoglucomutase-like phosphatase (HAD superfamily)|nr:HAD family phosphatase [Gemmatimonadaceae bacterium]
MIDAVLFEFEGVIADTSATRRRALLETFREDGVALSELEYVEHSAGMPVRASVRAALALRNFPHDETSVELLAMRTERRFADLVGTGLSLVDGAGDLIESLQGQARLGIVSRASRADIDTTLALAQLDHAFEFIIADDDTYPPKPSPAPYLGALDRLTRRRSVKTTHVVALEDGVAGIRSAKSAGLRCAVVGSLPVHLAVRADALIPSLIGQRAATIDALTRGEHGAER